MELRFGNVNEQGDWSKWPVVACVSAPEAHVFRAEFLIEGRTLPEAEMINAVEKELTFYLVGKGEADPWGYARYHCGTAANIYSTVHWSFFPRNFAARLRADRSNTSRDMDCGNSPMIHLTEHQIDSAIASLAKEVTTYQWLQGKLHALDVSLDLKFQKRFIGYYRVRRNGEWQKMYFGLLESHKNTGAAFGEMLNRVYEATKRIGATGRVEASFVSKLVATIDPHLPIIDSRVLKHLGLCLPTTGAEKKLSAAKEIHHTLVREYVAFLKTERGRYLVRRFREQYPSAQFTEVKMLDFVLWGHGRQEHGKRKGGKP